MEFSDELRRKGLLGEVPALDDRVKRKILGENYAKFVGIDIQEAKEEIADDEFSRKRRKNPNPKKYSTTQVPKYMN
jgi:hypothetical protein